MGNSNRRSYCFAEEEEEEVEEKLDPGENFQMAIPTKITMRMKSTIMHRMGRAFFWLVSALTSCTLPSLACSTAASIL